MATDFTEPSLKHPHAEAVSHLLHKPDHTVCRTHLGCDSTHSHQDQVVSHPFLDSNVATIAERVLGNTTEIPMTGKQPAITYLRYRMAVGEPVGLTMPEARYAKSIQRSKPWPGRHTTRVRTARKELRLYSRNSLS